MDATGAEAPIDSEAFAALKGRSSTVTLELNPELEAKS